MRRISPVRINWIERSLTSEEGLRVKMERIQEIARELADAIAADPPTIVGSWEKVSPGDPNYERPVSMD